MSPGKCHRNRGVRDNGAVRAVSSAEDAPDQQDRGAWTEGRGTEPTAGSARGPLARPVGMERAEGSTRGERVHRLLQTCAR